MTSKLFVAVLSILFSLSPAAHGAKVYQVAQRYSVGPNPGLFRPQTSTATRDGCTEVGT